MSKGLPATIDPIRLADEGVRLAGALTCTALRRVCALSLDDRARAEIDLEFGRSDDGVREMRGEIRLAMRVQCQRCLGDLDLALTVAPHLFFTRPEERPLADALDQRVVDKPVALAEMVEDELLLAMPMFPMHAEGRCAARVRAESQPASKPLAALERLKQRNT